MKPPFLLTLFQMNNFIFSMKNLKHIILIVTICLIVPVTFNFISYYGFVSTVPAKNFELESIDNNFGYGVYQHRILGKALLLFINDIVNTINIPDDIKTFNRIKEFLNVKSLSIYHSFFLLNTLFLCLTAFILYLLYNLPWIGFSETERIFSILFIIALISISQFMVLPYDVISYFFISFASYLLLIKRNFINKLILVAIIILGALNRETIALVLSFYLTILMMRKNWKLDVSLKELILLTAVFFLVYFGLRFSQGFDSSFTGRILFPQNILSFQNLIGFIFALFTTLIFLLNSYSAKPIKLFLLFSSPYVFIVILTGIMFEIRLWIPVIILMMIIQTISKSKYEVSSN